MMTGRTHQARHRACCAKQCRSAPSISPRSLTPRAQSPRRPSDGQSPATLARNVTTAAEFAIDRDSQATLGSGDNLACSSAKPLYREARTLVIMTPVILPPGRARLATKPAPDRVGDAARRRSGSSRSRLWPPQCRMRCDAATTMTSGATDQFGRHWRHAVQTASAPSDTRSRHCWPSITAGFA